MQWALIPICFCSIQRLPCRLVAHRAAVAREHLQQQIPPDPRRLVQGWRTSLNRSLASNAVTSVLPLEQRSASPKQGMDGYAVGA